MDPDQDPGDDRPDRPALTSIHARRAIDGEVTSIEWLVARLSPILVAHATYRLGPRLRAQCEPEDLVQDAWLVALPRLPTLRVAHGRAAPVLLKFLSSTITLRVQNLLRSHMRAGVRVTEHVTEVMNDIACERSGAVTHAVRRERNSELTRVLDELDPKDREILLLRGIEQIPTRTIGVLLELSPAAVSKRYERALQKLRGRLPGSLFEELDDELSEPGPTSPEV